MKNKINGVRTICITTSKGSRRIKERVTTFRTEKVLSMISPLSKSGIIKTDELLIDDGRLAGVASRCERLFFFKKN